MARGLTSNQFTRVAQFTTRRLIPALLPPPYPHKQTQTLTGLHKYPRLPTKISKTSWRASSPASATTFEFPSRTTGLGSRSHLLYRSDLHRSLFWFSIFHTSSAIPSAPSVVLICQSQNLTFRCFQAIIIIHSSDVAHGSVEKEIIAPTFCIYRRKGGQTLTRLLLTIKAERWLSSFHTNR